MIAMNKDKNAELDEHVVQDNTGLSLVFLLIDS